jgi:hypothetical protein
MLFRVWTDQPHRPTKDLDLLGYGERSVERFEAIVRAVCGQAVADDGLRFDPAPVHGGRIREDQEYEGLRIHFVALLERARVPLQIDIGFGDAITPAAVAVEFPTLLDVPAPALRAYPRETVVAQKYQAMVTLGIANSRMKDFYDLWVLARQFAFAGTTLAGAIRATFGRRKTALPTRPPLAWTPAFYDDATKKQQWQAFLKKSKLAAGGATLAQVCLFLSGFLMPPTQALCAGEEFPVPGRRPGHGRQISWKTRAALPSLEGRQRQAPLLSETASSLLIHPAGPAAAGRRAGAAAR